MRSSSNRLFVLHLLLVVFLVGCGARDADNNASLSPRLLATTTVVAPNYKPIVQQLYISYFGRPADTSGLASFQAQLGALKGPIDIQAMDQAYRTSTGVRSLVDSFGTSAESAALYSGDNTVFVTAIYRNLLNRTPDTSGLAFWVGAINNGSLTRANASLSIMAGALSNTSALGKLDAALIERKVTIGSNFTDTLATAPVNGYSGDAAAAQARAMLASVTATTDPAAFQSTINTLINDLAAPPSTAVFAGQYTGTYAGADAGTVSVTLAANGIISGSGRSTLDPTYQFTVTGQVVAGGLVSLTGSGSAGTATFKGTVTSQGDLSGTWSSPEGSGTFATKKATLPPVVTVPPGESVISGVVSIGPVSGATVKAYAVAGGTKGILLGSATTDASGNYVIRIGTYSGPILLEALGGHYTDPATGVVFELTKTLRSATVAGGAITANITPLTEAAIINAAGSNGGFTPANLTSSFLVIRTQIGFDPVTTIPIDPTVTLPATATTNNLIYGAHIGTVSQYLFEDQTKTLPIALTDFAQMFQSSSFSQSPLVLLAANNYGANDRNVNGLSSTLGSGNGMLATCTTSLSCLGPTRLPLCAKKPVITCIGSKVAINGVCVTPNTSPVTGSATTLSKSWSGPWNWAGPSVIGCHVEDGGSMTMNLTQIGTSFSGNVTAQGIQSANSACKVTATGPYSGTVKGSISAKAVNFTMSLNGTQLEFTGTGTLSDGVFSGSLVRVTGGSGSFNLH